MNILNLIKTKHRTAMKLFGQGSVDATVHELGMNDVFLASYPRSGNTWARNIIAHLLHPNLEISALTDLNDLVPDIHKSQIKHNPSGSLRVIKTHRPFVLRHNPEDSSLYDRNIYICRDPWNVFCSLYHYRKFKEPRLRIEDLMYDFLIGNQKWLSWQDHLLSWKSQEDKRKILFLRYEDMMEKPDESIRSIACFLNVDASDETITRIRSATSIEAMIRMERNGSIRSQKFDFIRRGKSRQESDIRILNGSVQTSVRNYCSYGMKIMNY